LHPAEPHEQPVQKFPAFFAHQLQHHEAREIALVYLGDETHQLGVA